MSIVTAENVYNTLTDQLDEPYQIPGVENAFAEGALCSRLYAEIYQANIRLCERLGQEEADPDVELIINNFLELSKYLCLKMYHYGQASSASLNTER